MSNKKPQAEPFPGYSKDLKKRQRLERETSEAAAEVLPGPLDHAYETHQEPIAGLTVRPVVHWDFVLLKRLNSPMLDQSKKNTGGSTLITDEQSAVIVYQFTRPCAEVEAVYRKGGAQGVIEAAAQEIGMRLSLIDVGRLVKAVESEFVRSFSTVLNYAAASTGETQNQTFPTPPPAMASGGGKAISAS